MVLNWFSSTEAWSWKWKADLKSEILINEFQKRARLIKTVPCEGVFDDKPDCGKWEHVWHRCSSSKFQVEFEVEFEARLEKVNRLVINLSGVD